MGVGEDGESWMETSNDGVTSLEPADDEADDETR
jgi:hypothetical protein